MIYKSGGAAAARARMIRRAQKKNLPPPFEGGGDMQHFLDFSRDAGLTGFYHDEQAKKTLMDAAALVWDVFSEQLEGKPVNALYLFREMDCTGYYSECCGMCSLYPLTRGGMAFKIGISAECVAAGRDMLLETLIHEACHVLAWLPDGHPPHWHGFLTAQLAVFEQRTGIHLEPDLCDYNGEVGFKTVPPPNYTPR